jgi:hypothetical protein
MKLVVILAMFTMSACGPWSAQQASDHRDTSNYRLIAGISPDEQSNNVPNPVVDSALRKSGVHFFYGDHSGRLTQLYCLREDVDAARDALDGLPQSERTAIVMFDSAINEASTSRKIKEEGEQLMDVNRP